MGLASARRYAQTLYDEALAALAASGLPDTRALQGLASLLVQRSS
jgi:farnesyl diphosphate synthase